MPYPEHVERRAKTELRGLRSHLMTQQDDIVRLVTTLSIVIGWIGWTFGLGLELLTQGGAVVGGFTIYQLVSLSILYILFRLNDVDVGQLIGLLAGGIGGDDSREREDDRRDRSGFRYGNDRRDDEK